MRVREIGDGRGFRLFQVRKPSNRHLVDVRSVEELPPSRRIARVLVMAPAELVASTVIAFCQRCGSPKSGTDWRDLAMLLLTFPELKSEAGPVTALLLAAGAGPEVIAVWRNLVAQEIHAADEDEGF